MTGSFHRQPWSEQEDAALRKLVAEGLKYSIIAIRLKRSPAAISRRAHELQLRPSTKRTGWRAGGAS